MFQNILHDLGGAGLYGVVSICLFFLVFTVAVIWALTRRASVLRQVEQLPFADDPAPTPFKIHNSHEPET